MIAILTLALTGTLTLAAEDRAVWLVSCPKQWVSALEPLMDLRRRDGFEVRVASSPSEGRDGLRGFRDFMLIVGDVEREADTRDQTQWHELYRWQRHQRREFASDSQWGDVDGDAIPDVPVGRLPVRTMDELKRVVAKIVAYEEKEAQETDLRILAWGGASGYNAFVDAMAADLLITTVRTRAPSWLETFLIAADERHPLCGWPPDQPRTFIEEMRKGSALSVLIGHGATDSMFSMRHRGQAVQFDASALDASSRAPSPSAPMVVFTCDSGDFTAKGRCLTESMVLAPNGPVAAIGATTNSHPLPNFLTAERLLMNLEETPRRLGSLWLEALRDGYEGRSLLESVLKGLEGSLEEEIDTRKLRRDQLKMYALLGDPATRLRLPRPMTVNVHNRRGVAEWTVKPPEGARELVVSFRVGDADKPVRAVSVPEAEKARQEAVVANQAMAFEERGRMSAQEAWEGVLREPGVWRWVALGAREVHVATFAWEGGLR